MHPESKMTNHETVSNNSQLQPPNVSLESMRKGLQEPKTNQMSPNNLSLKSGQSQVLNLGKGQGEDGEDVIEKREPRTPSLEPEPKEDLPLRTKRRCVLEPKQLYGGDEWCSGPDTDEEEKSLLLPQSSKSAVSSGINDSSSSKTSNGAGPGPQGNNDGPGGESRPPSQIVYIFTTYLANKAADAVLKSEADSILHYHQKNVPRAKLDKNTLQKPSESPNPSGATKASSFSPPALLKSAHQTTPSPSKPPPSTLPCDADPEKVNKEITPHPVDNGSSHPYSGHSNSPPQPTAKASVENPVEGDSQQGDEITPDQKVLSREKLEHRERSLQTLQDIERLLLSSRTTNEPLQKHTSSLGDEPTLPPLSVNPPKSVKKYEEPLQSMITQTQRLGGPRTEEEIGGPQYGLKMGQHLSLMMHRFGHDSLTPEQAAWRKLQEEYYVEKQRKEERVSIPSGSAPDLVLRGLPPLYHNKSGEQWVGNCSPGTLEGQEPSLLRSGGMTSQGPRFPARYGAMQNVPINSMGIIQRPGSWVEEVPSMTSGLGGFSQSGMPDKGGLDRFANNYAREEFLQQQLLQKRPLAMQRQISVASGKGTEMVVPHHQESSTLLTADSVGGGPGMGFDGSHGMVNPKLVQQETLRDSDPIGRSGNLNMNMSVNMNLNLQMAPHQHILQKSRTNGGLMGIQGSFESEELMRITRAQNGLDKQGFPQVQGPHPGIQQEMVRDGFGSELSSIGGPTKLSHISPSSAHGSNTDGLETVHMTANRSFSRRPSELTINVNQIESPAMNHLKSPKLVQVNNTPLMSSSTGNMKPLHKSGSQISGLHISNTPGSPHVLSSSLSGCSPSGSPRRLKSPQINIPSPGWIPSPKDGATSQNPLSLMMSQMSKYAMPSTRPLYHNAMKTIGTSDEDLLSERMFLQAVSQQGPRMPPISMHFNLSPSQNSILSGQPSLSHDPLSSLLKSPGSSMHPSDGLQNRLMINHMIQDPSCPGPGTQMMSSNQLVFPTDLQPGLQHNSSMSQGGGSFQQHFFDDMPTQTRLPPRPTETYGPGLSILSDPNLGGVIRPSASGIPEFDLSRIMPSEKPSSTLQYFPKAGIENAKPHSTNMHLLGLQNMMMDQHQGRLPRSQRSLPAIDRSQILSPSQILQENIMLMKQRSMSGEVYSQNSRVLSQQEQLYGQQNMTVGHHMRPQNLSLDSNISGPGHLPF
ncbi:B-cell CLL/lymphoma 9-like protein [Bombina bombina]|uniref:B-cell CLL/lymphoma 9-like protein n=1 Tax=Bombina bombina TaxID=8345 RepID=UPI00235A71CC|nr:B-cell CLL/lymphoma 9-like protein [Bombina bombina]